MTTIEFAVGKKDFRTAQEVLSRLCAEDGILISQNGCAAVYRIRIGEERAAFAIQALREKVKTFSLCAASKNDLPETDADPPKARAFRALNAPDREGEMIMRHMFGFKASDD